MTTDKIRKLYLEFFKAKAHEVVASDSLVPKDDPTLLFTGAGMNQFKEKFLGRNVTYRRAASSQKCLRTGDLENVGRTPRHHTFFEMLGNFSFGDYFKKEAILWAWEFLTVKLGISADRLWSSIYNDDEEAYAVWKDDVKIPKERIVRFGEKENFWPSEAPSKGPNGPCGPCSEIYYDYGANVGCGKSGCSPACDCGRFVEVWNLVFTQFDRQPDGSLKPLPNKNIDTGMGLERLASVVQGVTNNFDIDIFKPIIEAIYKTAKINPAPLAPDGLAFHTSSETLDSRTFQGNVQASRNAQINAIADHIRAVTFCIADGVMPSNEERGYVIRKLIRRAMSHGQDIGIREPFLYKLVSIVTDVMQEQYPDVKERRDDIAGTVKREEESFLVVIATQLPKVEEAFENVRKAMAPKLLAEMAFDFYDTYGMPYEMLEETAERHGLRIDKTEFEKFLDKQRELSRSKSKIKGEIFSETFAKKVEALRLRTEFLGYENAHAEAKVVAVLDSGEVILDRTPFYGESGGQAGDWGTIETKSALFKVKDAKKIGETIVHVGELAKGAIGKGDAAKVSIDEVVRALVAANHTATHLLQAALRKVLGDHVKQTGSLVDSEHLRFDFTHIKKMEPRELSRVEELVNDNIKKSLAVKKEIKDIEAAKKDGATALFGEKYDKTVRVVTVGDVSKELCGGTHVDNTSQIGLFRITGESSIASGVRRIEALTGKAAESWLDGQKKLQDAKLKAETDKDAMKKAMEKRIEEEAAKIDLFIGRARPFGGIKVVIENIGGISIEGLRVIADRIRQKAPASADVLALLSTVSDGKVSFVVSSADGLVKKGVSANTIAKEMAKCVEGSGGGRDNFAQGGGRAPSQLDSAVNKVLEILKEKLL